MLGWLKDWFGRFGGAVDATVLRMVHWALHALASVVYTVFSHVGRAWDDVYAAGNWLRQTAWECLQQVYRHLRQIILHDIPKLYHWAWARIAMALHDIHKLAVAALRWVRALEAKALHWIKDLYQWAWQHIYVPLFGYARWLEQMLRKWGYTAWWYITHPDKLAALLFWPLLALLEANAWRAAQLLGTFFYALFWHNMRRVAALAEDIITSVL